MSQLLAFLTRNRNFIIFLILEIASIRLIILNNTYSGATFFNTSNSFIARVLSVTDAVTSYTNLKGVNEDLAHENRILNEKLAYLAQRKPSTAPSGYLADSNFASRYSFVTAKVIQIETNRSNNYLTVDKGLKDGIETGMGVVSSTGVVGSVFYCTENYSVITSILNTNFTVSTKLLRSGEIGTSVWDAKDWKIIELQDVSRYTKVQKGDSAVTSDRNAVFPPGIMIGRVHDFKVHEDQTSFQINLSLSTDFRSLAYVYIVRNKQLPELNRLQDGFREKIEGAKKK